MICGFSFGFPAKPTSSATGANRCGLTARCPDFFMCAPSSSESRRRANTIAVCWHDCAWSPLIVMRSPVAESRRPEKKPLSVYSAGGDEINAKAQRRKGAKRMKPDQSCSPNSGRDAAPAGKTFFPCVFAPLRLCVEILLNTCGLKLMKTILIKSDRGKWQVTRAV